MKIDISDNAFIKLSSSNINLGESVTVGGFHWLICWGVTLKYFGNVNSLSPSNNFSKIQIDAAVQPGNSGGPIINQYGELIGVVEAMARDQEIFDKTDNFLKTLTLVLN